MVQQETVENNSSASSPVVRPPAPTTSVAAPPVVPPTNEAVKRIDAVLTKHGGNRTRAAEELGVSTAQLKNKIWYDAYLRGKWKLPKHSSRFKRSTIFEKPVVVAPGTTEVQVMETASVAVERSNEEIIESRLEKQDAKLRYALKRVGLNTMEVIEAMAAQQLHANHFASTVDIATANIAINVMKLPPVLRVLEARLMKALEIPEVYIDCSRAKEIEAALADEDRQLKLTDYTKMLVSAYTDLLEEARKTGEMVLHGSVIKARLSEMAKRTNVTTSTQAGKPKGAFGYGPKVKRSGTENTTQIVADHVTINNPPAESPKIVSSTPVAAAQ